MYVWPGRSGDGHAGMVESSIPRPGGSCSWICPRFPPSCLVPVPLWSRLTGVAMPCCSCTRIWPQHLPGMVLANSLQLDRQQDRCP